MKVIIEKELLLTRLDDEIALLNPKNGKYFSLNGTGARIWDLLEEYKETEEAFCVMLDEYNVQKDILRHDFNILISQLSDAGLVKLA